MQRLDAYRGNVLLIVIVVSHCWTRRGVAEWLRERLSEERPTLIGIDHGFSFPRHALGLSR